MPETEKLSGKLLLPEENPYTYLVKSDAAWPTYLPKNLMPYVNALWTNIQLCFYNFIRKLFNRKDYSLMTNGQSSLLWNSVIRYPDFQHHYFGQMSLPDDNKRPFSLFTAGVLVLFFLFHSFFQTKIKCVL